MAKILKIEKEHKSEIYDSRTGKTCKTEKVVDMTEDCPKASETQRAVLLFTRGERGRIVKICRPYEGYAFIGWNIHFFVDELNFEMNIAPRDDTFGSTARNLGLTKEQLRKIIEEHVPA